MTISDPLGDMITRLRNAQMRRKTRISVPGSRFLSLVLDVLKEEGYIRDYAKAVSPSGQPQFDIDLKYYDSLPVIKEIKRVSTPGRRVYAQAADIPVFANGLGVVILSTSRGVMADHAARNQNVGGEVLCRVF